MPTGYITDNLAKAYEPELESPGPCTISPVLAPPPLLFFGKKFTCPMPPMTVAFLF